ncbi:MAG: sensor histidine kinase, partial [Lentimicrobium sp.]|uniref:sensor histidine kinase n=1 Tax=Lentimicrobium sp. TaxID=2034841 RepID=UPI0025EC6CD6
NVHELCQEVVDEMNEMELVPNRIDLAVANDIGNASIDENLFRHIFINLLQNALNYSDKKQNVSFSVYPGEKGFINFKVADKGIGIPPQDMQFIYDPFYRASNSRHAKGSGLGLAVVKECLQLHNGEIFVESDPLKGSIFTVVIPVGNTE